MSIKSMLHEEIEDQLKELNKLEVGSESYKAAVDGVTKLIDKTIDFEKLEIDSQDKAEETLLKRLQFEEDQKDHRTKNVISCVGIIIPAALAIWGTFKTLKFEETGSITSTMGRGWINKLVPKK